ncbi:HNH endonuclease signature motif containing protein [Streptosporangium roseum]|uniref:HNH nuclease domain-containing protein n=1 Tax=Streptosporangium roseum (strain ATCC 12428 / DSM 43021 / JCM 3005 / KCTC 9067 / NCIMB 10171 / NRRL 2505 / NI 9100) TaxID=479432 RepID=D2AT16_STRRD|nr:HNH endonuclease signature motif containing protein [Streptosporangium roseum]ACZ90493.1 hypothetical protein Sros_7830 [Streptosporangium roseum DSM 43021]
MTLIFIDGDGLADLTSYLPSEQPAELATRAALSAEGLRISYEEPAAWLTQPCEGRNGYLHLPLYRREEAVPVELKRQEMDYIFMRDEAEVWAEEVLGLSSTAIVAVKASDCCGRAIDIAITTSNSKVLFDEQLECPCRDTAGNYFADLAEELFDLVLWANSARHRAVLVGWGMAGVLALTTEIRLLAEHPNRRFRQWGQFGGGIEWEDAQTWDAHRRGNWEGDDCRRVALAEPRALDECHAVLDRVRRMANSDQTEGFQFDLLIGDPVVETDSPILLPVRLGRENFRQRSDWAEYRYLCEQAEEHEKYGFVQRLRGDLPHRRARSTPAKRAVLLRCKGACENPDCENPGRPSDTSVGGGPILDVDHIDDHAKGGRDYPELMIALCPNCHAVKTRGRSRDVLRERLREVARERHLAWQSN